MKSNLIRASIILIFGATLTIGANVYSEKVEIEPTRIAGVTSNIESCLSKEETLTLQEEKFITVAEVKPVVTVDEADIDLLARLITAEMGYSTAYSDTYLYEKLCINTGSVVLNRMNSDKFPDTLYSVIYASGQYQCVINRAINRPYDSTAWEIAEMLLTEGSKLPENVVFQAEFTQGHGIYEKVGRTYFCYY